MSTFIFQLRKKHFFTYALYYCIVVLLSSGCLPVSPQPVGVAGSPHAQLQKQNNVGPVTISTSPPSLNQVLPAQPLDTISNQDVRVSLMWVYADRTRLAIEYRVKGNFSPENYNLYCPVNEVKFSDDAGTQYYPYVWASQTPVLNDNTFQCQTVTQGKEYHIIQTYQRQTAQEVQSINLAVSIHIGGFIVYTPTGEALDLAEYPLFVFNVNVPITTGLTREINLEKQSQDLTVLFQRLELNHSVAYLYYCVTYPNTKVWNQNLTIFWNNQYYPSTYSSRTDLDPNNISLTYDQVLTPTRCFRDTFEFEYDNQSEEKPTRELQIDFEKITVNYLDPPSQDDCNLFKEKIQEEYPEIDFECLIKDINGQGYRFSLEITHYPEAWEDYFAQQIIEQAFLSEIQVNVNIPVLVP